MTTPTASIASSRSRQRRRGIIALLRTGIQDVVGRRRLIRYLVGAELKRTHADTAFGQLWWILDPLLQMAVYFLLFAVMLNTKIPDYPLFLFVAILPWKWFSTTLAEATLSITGRQRLIRQIQFPKLVLPTVGGPGRDGQLRVRTDRPRRSSTCSTSTGSASGSSACRSSRPSSSCSPSRSGSCSPSLNAFFRDIQNVMRHALRLWFYLSGALIPLDTIANTHPSLYVILSLNPFAVLFKAYRAVT